jgi:hypothetical protein
MSEGPPKISKPLEQELAELREIQRALAEARAAGDLATAEALMEQHRGAVDPRETYPGLSLADAERLLGKESVLGPKDVEKVFGIKLDRIPPIPFSREEINRAKELGQQLILQVDTFSKEGMTHPINPATLCNAFTSAHDTKPLWYDNKGYITDPVISIESPRTGWRLTSKDLIPNSTENYLQQTDVLIEYLKKQVFKGAKLPKPYKDAIAEWKRKRAEIEPLATSETETEWNRGSQMLADLAITKLTRELLVEVMYRFILNDQINKDKPLPSAYTWTASRDSDGHLVDVGYFDVDGADVYGYEPRNGDRSLGDGDDGLGVSFSRS